MASKTFHDPRVRELAVAIASSCDAPPDLQSNIVALLSQWDREDSEPEPARVHG